jgi:hypothetical protein
MYLFFVHTCINYIYVSYCVNSVMFELYYAIIISFILFITNAVRLFGGCADARRCARSVIGFRHASSVNCGCNTVEGRLLIRFRYGLSELIAYTQRLVILLTLKACQTPNFTLRSGMSCKRRFSCTPVCVMLCVHVPIQIKPENKTCQFGIRPPTVNWLTIPVPETIGSHGCEVSTASLWFREFCWWSYRVSLCWRRMNLH